MRSKPVGRRSVGPGGCAKDSEGSTESRPTSGEITIVKHPLVASQLSILRAAATPPLEFRRSLQELAIVLLIEASRGWKTTPIEVQTPLQACTGARLTSPIVLVPILRAGLGLSDGMLRIVPDAAVGHIGLYRDPETLRPVSYYSRLPENIAQAQVLVLDPMLATGHTASAAMSMVKAHGTTRVQFICVVACPAGIAQLQSEHPNVPIIAAAIDPALDEFGYIVPGLGDAGDRYFGTG